VDQITALRAKGGRIESSTKPVQQKLGLIENKRPRSLSVLCLCRPIRNSRVTETLNKAKWRI
jgi:hypothetical protein